MTKKLLVLGAPYQQIPILEKAKEMGLYIGIVDYNNKAEGIPYADEYFQESIADKERMLEIAKEFQPDGVIVGVNEVPVKSAAYVCEQLNLPGLGWETALNVSDKGTMIKAFEKNGVAHPEYIVTNTKDIEDNSIPYPVITKPVDKSSSRGLSIAKNIDELKEALEYSLEVSDCKEVIIEEYMEGPEVSVEILVQDGEPHILQVTDKITTGPPHFIEMGHSQPSQLPEDALEEIRELAYNAAKAVGLKNSAGHAEIKLTKNGAKMVEIGGRQGGDCITTKLLVLTTGVELCEYTLSQSVGDNKKFDGEVETINSAAIRFIRSTEGTISEISGLEEARAIEGVMEVHPYCHIGDYFPESVSNTDRFCHVIATGETPNQAIERCEEAIKLINIKTTH